MSEFETARGRCGIEDESIRIRGSVVGTLRQLFRHRPVQFLALSGFCATAVAFLWWLSSTFAFIDPVFMFTILLGTVVIVLLFGRIQARFTRLSLAAEIPLSAVKKVVYVNGGKWGKPRFLIYFETGDAINVRPVLMGSFGNVIGDLKAGKKAFERAGFEVDDSMLNAEL